MEASGLRRRERPKWATCNPEDLAQLRPRLQTLRFGDSSVGLIELIVCLACATQMPSCKHKTGNDTSLVDANITGVGFLQSIHGTIFVTCFRV